MAVQKLIESRNTDATYEVARTFGYTDAAKIAFYETCWDMQSSCGMYLLFTTNKTLNQFKQDVQTRYPQSGDAHAIDGSSLLTAINSSTRRTLTINGNDGRNLGRLQITPPFAEGWLFTDQIGKKIAIRIYEVAQESEIYEVDGERIANNIVMVMIRTR